MGHLVYGVEAVRSLSRSEQVKTLLAGPSPTSPMRRRLPTPLFPTRCWLSHKLFRSVPTLMQDEGDFRSHFELRDMGRLLRGFGQGT